MSRKIGLSKTRPPNEAIPLGTPRPLKSRRSKPIRPTPFVKTAAYAGVPFVEKIDENTCTPHGDSLSSSQPPITASKKENRMTLTFKSINKRGSQAIYTGARTSIRVPVANFEGKTPAPTIEVEGLLGPKVKAKRVRLSKEERAALPKPTLAEKLERAEKRAAALKAKLAKEQTEPALSM